MVFHKNFNPICKRHYDYWNGPTATKQNAIKADLLRQGERYIILLDQDASHTVRGSGSLLTALPRTSKTSKLFNHLPIYERVYRLLTGIYSQPV